MENPEVTIVIPTINRPLKVIEAIKSIDNQTFKGNISVSYTHLTLPTS